MPTEGEREGPREEGANRRPGLVPVMPPTGTPAIVTPSGSGVGGGASAVVVAPVVVSPAGATSCA